VSLRQTTSHDMFVSTKTLVALSAAALSVLAQELQPFSLFEYKTIWAPPTGSRASYPRLAELEDGTLLVTTSVFPGGQTSGLPAFPLFQSKDGGVSWKQITSITDKVNGWGMGAQPAIMEMTQDLGEFKRGTLLASGNSWNFVEDENGVGTKIDLYASMDKGMSWDFVSHVAQGGKPNTTNGATPIWEPYLM
jgi:hypothetical protein